MNWGWCTGSRGGSWEVVTGPDWSSGRQQPGQPRAPLGRLRWEPEGLIPCPQPPGRARGPALLGLRPRWLPAPGRLRRRRPRVPDRAPGRGGLQRSLSQGGHGQRGLIGCLAFSPSQSLFACGSYGRSLGLYPLEGGGAVALWPRLPAAPTHLRFSPCGTHLYAGGRKDRHILCWDLRVPERPLLALPRHVATNQRVTFDLDPSGRFLVGGDTDGFVTVWDTLAPPSPGDPPSCPPAPLPRPPRLRQRHQPAPRAAAPATASGRLFPAPWDSDGDSEGTQEGPAPGGDIRLQLWWWGHEDTPGDTPGDSGTGHCHLPGDTECHTPGNPGIGDCGGVARPAPPPHPTPPPGHAHPRGPSPAPNHAFHSEKPRPL
uniref:telomerase Cajal body protein 1 n=1 Tax=Agelaius phoeniceus TaxID=39638 RepID=UPI0023EB4B98|nr:telomerase Cajal body protein 1 [Agelaius phoeniceus]